MLEEIDRTDTLNTGITLYPTGLAWSIGGLLVVLVLLLQSKTAKCKTIFGQEKGRKERKKALEKV